MDGTLCDSALGITHARDYVFESLGLPVPPMTRADYLGPGSTYWIKRFVGEARAAAGYKAYRHYYDDLGGLFESNLYDGIVETLTMLQKAGKRLFVTTLKPAPVAQRMARHFGIDACFEEITGSELSGKRNRKVEVIGELLSRLKIAPADAVMVGDRLHDVEGAEACGIPTIGALWGYGSREEFATTRVAALAERPADLIPLLLQKKGSSLRW